MALTFELGVVIRQAARSPVQREEGSTGKTVTETASPESDNATPRSNAAAAARPRDGLRNTSSSNAQASRKPGPSDASLRVWKKHKPRSSRGPQPRDSGRCQWGRVSAEGTLGHAERLLPCCHANPLTETEHVMPASRQQNPGSAAPRNHVPVLGRGRQWSERVRETVFW